MAKLIHSVSIAGIKNSTLLWASNAYTDLAKAALIFTDDGHIVVKGTDYKVALANNSEGTGVTQRRLWSESGTLKLRDAALFTYTGPKIDEVKTALLDNSSTMYITGSTSSSATTGTLKIKSSIYVTTDSAGNAVLAAPAVTVTGGASSLVLGSQTLLDYITDQITQGIQINDAMVFAGTLKVSGSDLVFVSHNSNLTYGIDITDGTTKLSQITKYSAGWTFKVVISGGAVTGIGTLEIGDMVIAVVNQTTAYNAANFTVVQANIDGAVTASAALTSNGLILGSGSNTVKILTTTATSGYLKPNGTNAPVWSSFGQLTLDGTADFVFNPAASNTLKIGKGLDITSSGDPAVYTLGHTNSVTAQTTAALKKFKFDAQGHITGVADVSKLTLKAQDASGKAVAASGIADKTYDGSAAVDFILKAGNNITLAQNSSGVIEIASSYTNTWRAVYAWLLSGLGAANDSIDVMLGNNINTRSLAFGPTFAYTEKSVTVGGSSVNVAEVDLVWADVDASGNITYSV